MGVVYKARQLKANRPVALKMILAGTYASDTERQRFQAEAEAVARLGHPNIVQVYEVGEHDGLPFFSLEFCAGGALDRKLAGTPLSAAAAARLAVLLAQAVQAAHEKNIVHRDLKPANVLLTGDGTPKVTDFGLAKQLDAEGTEQTRSGVVMGTPAYMAPEQAAGRTREIGPLADVYSLGAILYELLTGRPPFKGASVVELLEQVRSSEPLPPSRLTRKLPRELETICLKCLQKEPGRRYGSARELADDLQRYLNNEPILARPASTGERLRKWARRRPAQAVAVALLLVSVVAVIAGTIFYGRSREEEANAKEQEAAANKLQADILREREERRGKVVDLWVKGQEAEKADELDLAASRYNQALPLAPDSEWERRLKEAAAAVQAKRTARDDTQKLAAEGGKLQQSFERFRPHRDQVIFHSISFRKEDAANNLAVVRTEASQGLAQLALSSEQLERIPSELQRWRRLLEETGPVALECAEMLLAWAEAEAAVSSPRAQELRETAKRLLNEGARPAAAARLRQANGHLHAALDSYRNGRIPAALASCEKVLTDQPRDFRAQYLKALCNLHDQRWDLAQVGLTACLGQRKDHPVLLSLLGLAHGRQAASHKDRNSGAARKEFAAAEAAFERALAGETRAPYRAAVLNSRGTVRLQQGRWDEAHQDLREVIALQPCDYRGHVNLAHAYRGRRDLEQAVVALDAAIGLHNDAALYSLRARVQMQRGRPELARQDYETVVVLLKPGTRSDLLAPAHVELARLAHRARNHGAALAHCAKALEAIPDFAAAYRQRAESLLARHQNAEAATALDRYLDLEQKGNPRVRQSLARAYKARGILHAERGDYVQAIRAYDRSIGLSADAETLTLRGWDYLRLGSPTLALPDLEEAVRQAPANAQARCGRALARVQLIRAGKKDPEATVTRDVREVTRDADEAERLAHRKESFSAEDLRGLLLSCACVHARAVGVLETVGYRPANHDMASRCQTRALALLDQCMALVAPDRKRSYWRTNVRADPAFRPIRSCGGMFRRDQLHGQ
jgi:tetratricopeptide (TPR) repeat protein/tRNA A-37 threonylcarbamoyl transferase component Bud32